MQRLKGFPALLFVVLGNTDCFSVDPTSRRAAIAWVGTAIGCCAVERDRRQQAALLHGHQGNENRRRWWFWNADKDDDSKSDSESDSDSDGGDDGQETDSDSDDD